MTHYDTHVKSFALFHTVFGLLESFNSPVTRFLGRGSGGETRYPAYGFGAFRNRSENGKLNSPNRLQSPLDEKMDS